ncbi:hypothetical protein [Streptomyces milbemycinicus]|uniref:Uncharacterized protein n=1 Tax=Streptomyces milbemycinicus TaxID=476552 RepID=A0ABW8LZU9_9ACTN
MAVEGQGFVFAKTVVRDLGAQLAFYSDYSEVLGQVVKHRASGCAGEHAFEEVVMGFAEVAGKAQAAFRRSQAPRSVR